MLRGALNYAMIHSGALASQLCQVLGLYDLFGPLVRCVKDIHDNVWDVLQQSALQIATTILVPACAQDNWFAFKVVNTVVGREYKVYVDVPSMSYGTINVVWAGQTSDTLATPGAIEIEITATSSTHDLYIWGRAGGFSGIIEGIQILESYP